MTFDRRAVLPADQTTVRRANLGVVLRHVAAEGSRSRAQIAAETGLTRGTVSSLVTELIDLALLRETGETTSPRGIGRPGVALEVGDVVVGVGLEVNVDYVAVSVEDLTGAVRYERRMYRDNRDSVAGAGARSPRDDRPGGPRGRRPRRPAARRDLGRGAGTGRGGVRHGGVRAESRLARPAGRRRDRGEARSSCPRRERVESRRARRALDRSRGRDRRLRLRVRRGRRRRRHRARRAPLPGLARVRRRVRPHLGRPRRRAHARAAAAAASRRSSARSRLRARPVSPPQPAARAA